MLRKCVECGSEVPENSRQGYCPKCLLNLAVAHPETIAIGFGDNSLRQLPRALGDYELVEMLGEGGMGIVFKATQKKLNRTVALKMLRSGLMASKEELTRFRTEAQAVARLTHPNIVRVHEIGEYEGRLFFSMDWIQGRSLAEIVGRTPLPPERAVRYTLLIAQAVHYAHTQGVLHRDLKPGNVLLDQEDRPHITDFGLAKEISGDAEVTQSGAILGTPSYMSPEQAAGRRKMIKPASDVYSLGAILYDLLTGRPPFRADSPAETMRQVMEQEPAPLRLLNAKVPRDLETICLKCLSKDPVRRYDSAQLLAEDLERFLRHEPIFARRAGRVERTYRWAKRHPTLAALGITAAVMFVLVGQIALFSHRDARNSVEVAPRMAKGLAYDLYQIGATVSEVARKEGLVDAVSRNQNMPKHLQLDCERNEVLRILSGLLSNNPSLSLKFENWLLLGTNGQILANHTRAATATSLDPKSTRDYFVKAAKLTNGYCVSKAYKSDSDHRYKVAVISPLLNFEGVFQGALGRMVAYTELASQTERTKTAVLAAMDPTSARTKYAVLWHPDLDEESIAPIPDESALSKTLDRVMNESQGATLNNYEDPAGGGRWVAGLARVPQSPLVQVYQVRDRIWQAELTAAFLGMPCAAGLTFWFLRKRRHGHPEGHAR